MNNALSWTNFYKHPRFWRHFGLWTITFLFLHFIIYCLDDTGDLGSDDEFYKLPYFVMELLTVIYCSFYLYNTQVVKKRYGLIVLGIIAIIVFVSFIESLIKTNGIMVGELENFWAQMIVLPMILMMAFGFKFAYHGARQIFVIHQLEAKQNESELKLLKSQVNPHFLFNTLNNIYATNLNDHEKANDIILELADLLRYQLESNKKQLTHLSAEIKSLENYIELEKIRVKDCEVRILKSGDFSKVEIVPLLLIPFVENAFKYGTGIEPGAIDIKFEIDGENQFAFQCVNKIVQKNGKVHSGGIGLENVKKRLELMYPNKYALDIKADSSHFVVDLKIQL